MDLMKRPRGAQPGNQNARKHGFFSEKMSPDELCEYLGILRQGKIPAAVAAFNVKFKSAVERDPANLRIIRHGVSVLLKLYDDDLSVKERRTLKRLIRRALEINRAYYISLIHDKLNHDGVNLGVSLTDSVAALEQTLFHVAQNEYYARRGRKQTLIE